MYITKRLVGLMMLLVFQVAHTQNRPNIILMMADDLGWGDTGYNGNKIIKTPYLDQMAAEGVQMNRFYAASAVCSPTRASVLTGRNPYRTGVFTANKGILRPEETTLVEILKAEGYATGHFGKWHLGTLTHTERESNRGKPGNLKEFNPPVLHGYDNAFVTEAKVPTYNPMVNTDIKKPNSEKNGTPYGTPYRDIDGKKVTENLDGDDSRVIMDRVLPFVKQAKKEKKPFVAIVWFHTPHKPCVAGPKHLALYKDQPLSMQHYGGCITAMDEQIGRLRNFLNKEGLANNTMLTFCSDNGPENGNPGSSGPFRERKRSMHEGGIRVPGLMVWPAKIKQPIVSNQPFVTSDYLPTILDALGLEVDPKIELDGESMLPILLGKKQTRSEAVTCMLSSKLSAQDAQYKIYAENKIFELYDMQKDSLETRDLALEKPEILEAMKTQYMSWLSSVKSSFEGQEYGVKSVERMKQRWESPLTKTTKKKQVKKKKKSKSEL